MTDEIPIWCFPDEHPAFSERRVQRFETVYHHKIHSPFKKVLELSMLVELRNYISSQTSKRSTQMKASAEKMIRKRVCRRERATS